MFMKHVYKVFFVLAAVPAFIALFASSNGSPGGRSGSPGDNNQTCTACHSGTAVNQTGWISTNIPASGYVAGQTYQLTLNGTQAGVSKFGFEFTAENASGQKTGSFAITEATRTKLVNQNKAVTHTSAGTAASGGATSWTFNWTAPAASTGEVRFYATVNATNSNGNTAGDVVYKTSLFVGESAPAALVSVSPQEAEQGSNPVLTINGQNTNWSGSAPAVMLQGAGGQTYSATDVAIVNENQITASFSFPVDAIVGVYDLKVGDLVLANAFTITILSSLADISSKSVNVYPNPATEYVTIASKPGATITIFTAEGKMIQQFRSDSETAKLELSTFQKGLYLIDIKLDANRIVERLIVK